MTSKVRISLRVFATVVLAVAPLGVTAGCSLINGPRASVVEPQAPYDGPPATLRTMNGRQAAVFTAPTGGWSVRFDSADAAYRETHVFVTITKPDPSLSLTQQLVEHAVATPVEENEGVRVFARVLEHSQESPVTSPYRVAVAGGAQGVGVAR